MKTIFKVLTIWLVLSASLSASGQEKIIYPMPILHEDAAIYGYAYNYDRKRMAINYRYEEANQFESASGLAIVQVNGYRGAINIDGNYVIEPIYESVSYQPYSNTYVVLLDGKYGAINTNGDIILPIKYDDLYAQPKAGWYEAKLGEDYFYIAPDGHTTSDWSEYLNAPEK